MFTYGVLATLFVFGILVYIRLMNNLTSLDIETSIDQCIRGTLLACATDVFIGYVFIRVLTVYFLGW